MLSPEQWARACVACEAWAAHLLSITICFSPSSSVPGHGGAPCLGFGLLECSRVSSAAGAASRAGQGQRQPRAHAAAAAPGPHALESVHGAALPSPSIPQQQPARNGNTHSHLPPRPPRSRRPRPPPLPGLTQLLLGLLPAWLVMGGRAAGPAPSLMQPAWRQRGHVGMPAAPCSTRWRPLPLRQAQQQRPAWRDGRLRSRREPVP